MIKIGIIGAMDLEIATLKEQMTVTGTSTFDSMEFLEGTLNNLPVVIVKCGIGKVNAGICVQILMKSDEMSPRGQEKGNTDENNAHVSRPRAGMRRA